MSTYADRTSVCRHCLKNSAYVDIRGFHRLTVTYMPFVHYTWHVLTSGIGWEIRVVSNRSLTHFAGSPVRAIARADTALYAVVARVNAVLARC